jgi:hypothetical protein
MRAALAAGLTLAAGSVVAQEPPLWANLAECSAVFRAASHVGGYGGVTAEQVAAAEAAAAAFRGRAVEVAAEMGQAEAEADVASIMVYLEPRWDNRIDRLFSVKSNLDWFAYCGRLGREQGVPIPNLAP